ncbi:MAG: ABC transporter substrate-binding protein, partial [Sphingobacteriaceae bacterium]
MITLKVALDWTPNTNHTGFFIAKDLGFYAEQGLQVDLLTPADDDYAVTPAKKLESGLADFAIAPFESVISLNNKASQVKAVAIAALLQQDISSVATLASQNITRPKDLDNRIYAS